MCVCLEQREQETKKEEEGREKTGQGEQDLVPCKEDFDSKEMGATEGCRKRKKGSSLRF